MNQLILIYLVGIVIKDFDCLQFMNQPRELSFTDIVIDTDEMQDNIHGDFVNFAAQKSSKLIDDMLNLPPKHKHKILRDKMSTMFLFCENQFQN